MVGPKYIPKKEFGEIILGKYVLGHNKVLLY